MGVYEMLTINLGTLEYFDPETSQFEYEEGGVVRFEYSLKTLYDWEGRWKKAFLDNKVKLTSEEIIDFYRRMALDPFDTRFLTKEVMTKLSQYIADSNTATKFRTPVGTTGSAKRSGKIYTAEEIYALMFNAGIPMEFEHRNLNRLLVILKVISINNSPPKKMSKADVLKQNAKINAERKAKYNTKG